ncbi:TniB protein [Paenibacillus polysaccharolyticus]|uniref:TniB protein n=1 Tax=Paenibacillus polysaccharolyticus TaxID=582692 RepID=A0A1G5GRI0_9BACL|nr:TniB family NTP-binding protein [Paenibacillus polysaccharolyticus]SCY54205.1 TniB protein [Paenibacillus polysaccharolyticus]
MMFKALMGQRADMRELNIRKERTKEIIIHHPQYSEILNELEMMLYFSEDSVNPEGAFVYGSTGVGKSTLAKEFRDRYPKEIIVEDNREFTHIPVLYVIVPPKATNRTLASKILEEMGDPLHYKGTEALLTSRIHNYVKKLGIKMIILDELQHLIDADTDHVLKTASNWVKTFTEEVGIAVVLSGITESFKVFLANPQLDRRYCNKIELLPFSYGTVEEILNFRTFLKKIDSELPFSESSNLADPNLSSKIYYVSKGIPFYVMKLLEEATVSAALNGADSIREIDLAKALTKIKQVGRPFVSNPFSNEEFDLESVIKREDDLETKYKVELIEKGKKGKKGKKQ